MFLSKREVINPNRENAVPYTLAGTGALAGTGRQIMLTALFGLIIMEYITGLVPVF